MFKIDPRFKVHDEVKTAQKVPGEVGSVVRDKMRAVILKEEEERKNKEREDVVANVENLGKEQREIAQRVKELILKWQGFLRDESSLPHLTAQKIRVRIRALNSAMRTLLVGSLNQVISADDLEQGVSYGAKILTSQSSKTQTDPKAGEQSRNPNVLFKTRKETSNNSS